MKVFTTNKHWCRMKIKHGNVRHIDGNNKTQSGLSPFVLWNFSQGTVSNGYISSHSSQLYVIPTYVNCIYYPSFLKALLRGYSHHPPTRHPWRRRPPAAKSDSPQQISLKELKIGSIPKMILYTCTVIICTWKPATHTIVHMLHCHSWFPFLALYVQNDLWVKSFKP